MVRYQNLGHNSLCHYARTLEECLPEVELAYLWEEDGIEVDGQQVVVVLAILC